LRLMKHRLVVIPAVPVKTKPDQLFLNDLQKGFYRFPCHVGESG
jgi:hypothetical protein